METVPLAECTAAYLKNINGCYAVKDGQNNYLLFDSKKNLNSEALQNLACNSALNFYTVSQQGSTLLYEISLLIMLIFIRLQRENRIAYVLLKYSHV